MMATRGTLAERFAAKYIPEPNSGCWLWTAAVDDSGYGVMFARGRARASRISLVLAGRTIPPGMCACHHCDTPACVNPDHLYIGTRKQNSEDIVRRGRWTSRYRPRGADNHAARLTEESVRRILYGDLRGFSLTEAGRALGVTKQAIALIRKRVNWRHI